MVLLFCVAFLSISRAYAEESYPYLAQAKADNVIVRAGQNLNFEILFHLKKGALHLDLISLIDPRVAPDRFA